MKAGLKRAKLTLLVLGALVACLGLAVRGDAVEPATPQTAGELLPIVTGLIGDAECDDDSQCRVIGIGARPCGGPASYRAWSSKGTEEGALQVAVQAHAQAQQQENGASGKVSNCLVLPMPAASCQPRVAGGTKACQLGSSAAGGATAQ